MTMNDIDTNGNPIKAKNKKNPFADQMRPTEQLLWTDSKARPSMWGSLAGIGVFILIIAVSVGFGIMSDKTLKNEDKIGIAVVIVGGTLAIAAVVLVLMSLYRLLTGGRRPEQAYAITNERLLYRSKKTVSSIPLEKLPSVSLFLGDGTKGTFSFGAFFPMWSDVENAIEVKHMMDDAQKQRLQKIAK